MVTGVVADVSGLGLVDSKVPGGGGGCARAAGLVHIWLGVASGG